MDTYEFCFRKEQNALPQDTMRLLARPQQPAPQQATQEALSHSDMPPPPFQIFFFCAFDGVVGWVRGQS